MAELSGTIRLQSDNSPVEDADVLALSNAVLTDTFTVTVDPGNVFTSTTAGHGLVNGNVIRFTSTTTLPAPLEINTDYFVISTDTADTFKVSSVDKGGTSVVITTTGTGTHTFTAKVWSVAGSSISIAAGAYAIKTGTDDGPFGMHCEGLDGATVLVSTGKANVTPAPVVNADAFIMEVRTVDASTVFTFPTFGEYTVDWGDDTGTEAVITSSPTHTYVTPGTYDITVTDWLVGGTKRINFASNAAQAPLVWAVKQWGNTVWTSMKETFINCSNMVLTATDVPTLSSVTDCEGIFNGCTALGNAASLADWPVHAGVTTIRDMFKSVTSITTVDLSTKTTPDRWNVSGCQEVSGTFMGATNFNGNITNWDMGAATTLGSMFVNANSFNQDVSGWRPGAITGVGYANAFRLASAFNQDLSGWAWPSGITAATNFVRLSGIDVVNYSKLLISIANQVKNNPGPYNLQLAIAGFARQYNNTVYAGIQTGAPYDNAEDARAFLAKLNTGTFTLDDVANTVTITPTANAAMLHGLIAGDIVQFTTTDTLPGGLAPATNYYVRTAPTTTTITLSTTVGREAELDLTAAAGVGTHTITTVGTANEGAGYRIIDDGLAA